MLDGALSIGDPRLAHVTFITFFEFEARRMKRVMDELSGSFKFYEQFNQLERGSGGRPKKEN